MRYGKLLRLLIGNLMFYAVDDEGGGGGAPSPSPAPTPTPAPVPTPTPAAKTGNPLLDRPLDEIPSEWLEHAKELRRENARLREITKSVDEKATKEKLEAAVREAVDAQAVKTQEIIKTERDASNRRIINAEVRAAATNLGIQNMDDLKLVDASKLTINEDTGEVLGVSELLAEFKRTRPYLFKEPVVDTTQARRTPDKTGGKPFDARTATPDEIKADAKARGLTLKNY
jgi:hypothetical protein